MKPKAASGHHFDGIAVSATQVIMVASLNQLETLGVESPFVSAKTSFAKTPLAQQPFKQLRVVTQRAWDKTRDARAELYCGYLQGMSEGKHTGAVPPVTLYLPAAPIVGEDGDITIPYRSVAIAIDGETQLEARFRLRASHPETGDELFAVVLHHSITEAQAVQILHDVNRYCHPIPESKLGVRNSSGGISQTIAAALQHAGLKPDDLNRIGTAGTKKLVGSFSQCMFFVGGFHLANRGLAINAATVFDEMNRPGTDPMDLTCVKSLVGMFNMCQDQDDDVRLAKRKMPSVFWQVAGVCAAEGMDVEALNWDGAFEADRAVAANGRGGPRMTRAQRQGLIYDALKQPSSEASMFA